jgi:hypothetical protein
MSAGFSGAGYLGLESFCAGAGYRGGASSAIRGRNTSWEGGDAKKGRHWEGAALGGAQQSVSSARRGGLPAAPGGGGTLGLAICLFSHDSFCKAMEARGAAGFPVAGEVGEG